MTWVWLALTADRPDTADAAAVAEGQIHVPIARVLPLAEAAEAHRSAEAGGLPGKIILTP